MRCITRQEGFEHGIKVVRSGDTYYVCLNNDRSVAFVSEASFKEMLARGHAIEEVSLHLQTEHILFGKLIKDIAGAKIFRCDVEIKEGAAWLIPEKPESKNSVDVLVLIADTWARVETTPTFTEGAQLISMVTGRYGESHSLVSLCLDSGILVRKIKHVRVSATGWSRLNPLHTPECEERPYEYYELYLSELGILQY